MSSAATPPVSPPPTEQQVRPRQTGLTAASQETANYDPVATVRRLRGPNMLDYCKHSVPLGNKTTSAAGVTRIKVKWSNYHNNYVWGGQQVIISSVLWEQLNTWKHHLQPLNTNKLFFSPQDLNWSEVDLRLIGGATDDVNQRVTTCDTCTQSHVQRQCEKANSSLQYSYVTILSFTVVQSHTVTHS